MPPARPRSNPRNAAPRRRDQEVLAAAVKVFAERGYAVATVQDVADELGILKGSLYHYIDTKEDLLFRLCESVHRDGDVLLEEVRAAEGLRALDRLRLLVRRQVEYNLEHRAAMSVYHRDMDLLGKQRHEVVASARATIRTFATDLIREAQAAGDADPEQDAELLASCLFSTISGTYRLARAGNRGARQKVAEASAAYVVGGLRGEHRIAPAAASSV